MRMTKRDMEVLKFINDVGYCTAVQLARRFGLNMRWMYKLMKRLVNGGLVGHTRIYFKNPGVYFLTLQGSRFTSLSMIDGISKGVYDHQLMLVDLVIKLREVYPDSTMVCERHLKQQKFQYGIGKLGHIADGVLIFPDDKKVAIELELSMKGKQRLEKIFRAYGAQLNISEVWYFCVDEVRRGVSALSERKSFIKVFSLKEFLHG